MIGNGLSNIQATPAHSPWFNNLLSILNNQPGNSQIDLQTALDIFIGGLPNKTIITFKTIRDLSGIQLLVVHLNNAQNISGGTAPEICIFKHESNWLIQTNGWEIVE